MLIIGVRLKKLLIYRKPWLYFVPTGLCAIWAYFVFYQYLTASSPSGLIPDGIMSRRDPARRE